MKILAIEFSSAERSVALVESPADPSARCLASAKESGSKHTRAFHLIDQVLDQARIQRQEIDGIAVGLGPGSYTGIRMAIALAQGWHLARNLPLFGLSSVTCLARQYQASGGTGRVNIIVDAQRGEFYLAGFEVTASIIQEAAPLAIVGRSLVEEKIARGERVIGPETSRWFEQAIDLFPNAATLGTLALRQPHPVAGESLEPIYLRETTFVKAPPPRQI